MNSSGDSFLAEYEKEFIDACSKKDYDFASEILNKELQQAEIRGQIDGRLMYLVNTLAAKYCLQQSYAKAEALYTNGLRLKEKLLGLNHPEIVDSLERLAVVVRETRGTNEAKFISFRAQTIAARGS